jgi:hypothetical protein
MSGGSIGRRYHGARIVLLGLCLGSVAVLGPASSAFAAVHHARHIGTPHHIGSPRHVRSTPPAHPGHASPRVAPRVASFIIPTTSPPGTVWMLNLWRAGQLLGSDSGTSGVLTVTVPRAVHGTVQADVRRNGRWFSGARASLPGRGGTGGHGGGGTGGKGGGGTGGQGGHSGGGTGGQGGTGGSGGTGGTGGSGGSGSSGTGGTGSGATGSGGAAGTGTPSGAPSTAANGGTAPTGSGPGSTVNGPNGSHIAALGGRSAGPSAPPVPATDLAFTGAGSAFWTTAIAGLGLLLLGAYLLARRRARGLRPESGQL